MIRFAPLAAALLLAACSPQKDHRGYILDPMDVERISVGVSTRDQVLIMMGTPSVTSTLAAIPRTVPRTIVEPGDGPYVPEDEIESEFEPVGINEPGNDEAGIADETDPSDSDAFDTGDLENDNFDLDAPLADIIPDIPATEVTWFYVSSDLETSTFHKPAPTDRQILAILFNPEGIVDRVDLYNLSDAMEFEFSEETTPTYGTDLNLLQELFRNLGRFNQQSAPQ